MSVIGRLGLFFVLLLKGSFAATPTWISVDIYSSDAACQSNSQNEIIFQALSEMEICLIAPPVSAFVQSVKFECSTLANGMVEVDVTAYADTVCGTELTEIEQLVDGACQPGGWRITCGTEKVALTEVWPAVGFYLEDLTCSAPLAIAAGKPNGCYSSVTDEFGELSLQSSCPSNNLLVYNSYNGSATCNATEAQEAYPGQNVTFHYEVPTESCEYIGEFQYDAGLNTQSINSLQSVLMTGATYALGKLSTNMANELSIGRLLAMITVTANYYASCGGVYDLPGILSTIVDDDDPVDPLDNDNDSEDNDSLGGTGIALLVVFLVGGAIAAVVGVIFYRRHSLSKGTENLNSPLNNL